MRDVKAMLVKLKLEIAAESSGLLLQSPQNVAAMRHASVGRIGATDRKRVGASPLAALGRHGGMRSRQHSRFKSQLGLNEDSGGARSRNPETPNKTVGSRLLPDINGHDGAADYANEAKNDALYFKKMSQTAAKVRQFELAYLKLQQRFQ